VPAPQGEIRGLFRQPALIVPAEFRLADGANARQQFHAALAQQQAETGAAQQQIFQVHHRFDARRPA